MTYLALSYFVFILSILETFFNNSPLISALDCLTSEQVPFPIIDIPLTNWLLQNLHFRFYCSSLSALDFSLFVYFRRILMASCL